MDLDACGPLSVLGNDGLEGDRVIADGSGLGGAVDLDPAVYGSPLVGDREGALVRFGADLPFHAGGSALLHGEEVGEVGLYE